MNTLFYSERCSHCAEVLDFVDRNHDLKKVTRFHDVNRQGVPKGITRVPTLVKLDGTVVIGKEILDYFDSLIVPSLEGNDSGFGTFIDGGSDESNLDRFGASLAPRMTKDLEAKINANVKESFKVYEPV